MNTVWITTTDSNAPSHPYTEEQFRGVVISKLREMYNKEKDELMILEVRLSYAKVLVDGRFRQLSMSEIFPGNDIDFSVEEENTSE